MNWFKGGLMTDQILEEIGTIKDHLKGIAPKATDIKVDVKELRPGLFESKIRVKLPRKKAMLAFKRSYDPISSLVKVHQAILKQLIKEKSKRKRVKPPLLAA